MFGSRYFVYPHAADFKLRLNVDLTETFGKFYTYCEKSNVIKFFEGKYVIFYIYIDYIGT